MIPTYKVAYHEGELRIGWASWDKGELKERSIKYAYRDITGKISRGCPELPFFILRDMYLLALEQKEISAVKIASDPKVHSVSTASRQELSDELKLLNSVQLQLQHLGSTVPWASWGSVYDQIGARREAIKGELATRDHN